MPKQKFKKFAKVQRLISPNDTRLFVNNLFNSIYFIIFRKSAKETQEKKMKEKEKAAAPIVQFVLKIQFFD